MTWPGKEDCTGSYPDPKGNCPHYANNHHCDRPGDHAGDCRCLCGKQWTVHR